MIESSKRKLLEAMGIGPSAGDRILSIRQPWAWMVVSGHKPIENRTWGTDRRGLVWIHASGKPLSGDEADQFAEAAASEMGVPARRVLEAKFPVGGLIGAVWLEDVFDKADAPAWTSGMIHAAGPKLWWLSAAVELARPIAYRGQLNLTEFDAARLGDKPKLKLNVTGTKRK